MPSYIDNTQRYDSVTVGCFPKQRKNLHFR